MKIRRLLIAFVLFLSPLENAFACGEPPKASFRDLVGTAPTIFTFQLTSAFFIHKPLGSGTGAGTEYVVGLIRVLESLKGDATSFRLVTFGFRSCGAYRMSVGQIYLAATSQTGQTLTLGGTDQAILDLTLDFYHESTKRSPTVEIVKGIVAGKAVPNDFPRDFLEIPLEVYPAPPPPEHQQ